MRIILPTIMPWSPLGLFASILSSSAFSARCHLGPETLALSLEIELVDLRVEHRADDGAPLVGAQDSVARVGDLSQIGTDETARGQAINSLPTEPDGRQEQNHGHGQAEIERTRMLARRRIHRCIRDIHDGDSQYKTSSEP